ncbi:MAG: RagB/SusD family nutrient uptake outer membrane protein [Bacteroidales bacterium]|nr:RagB/SusD family nutrient uptake outer membrane protein [Bacteroidales bacterium]
MKTSKLIFTAACTAVALLSVAGCENAGFLNQAPYSQTSPENFYTKESDLKLALTSCYEAINTHKIPGKGNAQRGSYAQGLIYIMNAPSDDIGAATASGTDGYEMEWGSFIESTECVRDFWKVFYTGINRCNIVLAYLDKINLTESSRIQFEAEARFMRAFFYYHLAWNFGGVPIVTDYASSGMEPRSPLKDVYNFIFDDLEFAYGNLDSGSGLIPGCSINRFGAAAYIGRICNYLAAMKRNNTGADLALQQPLNDLSWVDAAAMTEKARAALEDVVNNSSYRLNEDFMANFRECSKVEQNIECLFLSQMSLSGSEGWWPNSYFLPTPASGGSDFPTAYGGRHVPFPRAFYMYVAQDPRRDRFFTGRLTEGFKTELASDGYTYGQPTYQDPNGVIDYDEEGNPIKDPVTGEYVRIPNPLYETPEQTYLATSGMQMCPGKFRLAKLESLQHTYQQHSLSYPLMRLADVYLMYAEALYFGGNEPLAREWCDKVTYRAAGAEGKLKGDEKEALYEQLRAAYHRDDFLEELLESRERELIFEFSRKWDMIRFNRIDAAIESLNSEYVVELEGKVDSRYLKINSTSVAKYAIDNLKANWAHHKIWLPISEEQTGVNKSLSQNAGWGSIINAQSE